MSHHWVISHNCRQAKDGSRNCNRVSSLLFYISDLKKVEVYLEVSVYAMGFSRVLLSWDLLLEDLLTVTGIQNPEHSLRP